MVVSLFRVVSGKIWSDAKKKRQVNLASCQAGVHGKYADGDYGRPIDIIDNLGLSASFSDFFESLKEDEANGYDEVSVEEAAKVISECHFSWSIFQCIRFPYAFFPR